MENPFKNLIFETPEDTASVLKADTNFLSLVKGDKGEKGDKGDPGESIKGDKGDKGESIKGDKGEKGEQGQASVVPGPKGDKGDPGKDAVLDEKLLVPIIEKIDTGMKQVDGRIKLIDQRWHGSGLSKVSHDTTLSGDGTPSNPLMVIGGGSVIGSGSAGQVTLWKGSTLIGGDDNFFWNNTSKSLRVGAVPGTANPAGTAFYAGGITVLGNSINGKATSVMFNGETESAGPILTLTGDDSQTSGTDGTVRWREADDFDNANIEAGHTINSANPGASTSTYITITNVGRATSLKLDDSSNLIYSGGKVGIRNTSPGALLTLGTAGTTAGNLSFAGATSGTVTMQVAAAAGTWSMTLPTTAGTSGMFLQTNGSGVTTWASGLASPLTTKGDLWGFSTVNARLPVGSNNQAVIADSTATLGVKYAAIVNSISSVGSIMFTGSTGAVSANLNMNVTNTWLVNQIFDSGLSSNNGIIITSGDSSFEGNVSILTGGHPTAYNLQLGSVVGTDLMFYADKNSALFGIGDISDQLDGAAIYSSGTADTINIHSYVATKIDGLEIGGTNDTRPGQVITYNSITTAGYGVSPIYATGNVTGQTAANTSVATFTPNNDGTFRVGGYIIITAVAVDVLNLQVTFTDQNNVSRTMTFFPQGVTSGNLSTTGFYAFPTMDIRAKGSTAITVKTVLAVGGGSITYDVGASISQIS